MLPFTSLYSLVKDRGAYFGDETTYSHLCAVLSPLMMEWEGPLNLANGLKDVFFSP